MPLPLQPDDKIMDTQKTGETTNKFLSRRHFLELLDHWNADHRWKYWGKPS